MTFKNNLILKLYIVIELSNFVYFLKFITISMYPDSDLYKSLTLISCDITRIVSPMLFLHNIGVLAINSQSFNSLSLCHLLITFTNSFDPDQARQNIFLK